MRDQSPSERTYNVRREKEMGKMERDDGHQN